MGSGGAPTAAAVSTTRFVFQISLLLPRVSTYVSWRIRRSAPSASETMVSTTSVAHEFGDQINSLAGPDGNDPHITTLFSPTVFRPCRCIGSEVDFTAAPLLEKLISNFPAGVAGRPRNTSSNVEHAAALGVLAVAIEHCFDDFGIDEGFFTCVEPRTDQDPGRTFDLWPNPLEVASPSTDETEATAVGYGGGQGPSGRPTHWSRHNRVVDSHDVGEFRSQCHFLRPVCD